MVTRRGHLLRSVEAEQLGVGGFVGVEVLAGGLAKLLGRRGHVEDVVGHLREVWKKEVGARCGKRVR